MASRDEKILLKLQKENHDLSLLSTEKKLCQKYSSTKKFNTTLQFENGQFEGVLKRGDVLLRATYLYKIAALTKERDFFEHF